MRNRFFFVILATLVTAAVGINWVHVYFFKNQRLSLIDRQIRDASAALLQSQTFNDSVKDPDAIEEAISKVLKGTRIGKVFILRDPDKKIIYQSFNASLLQTELPISPAWVVAETPDEYIRMKNISLPGVPHRILQVGLVVDRNFLEWEIVDQRIIGYISAIVISLFLASVFLTLFLLAPLRLLIGHLNEATSHLGNLKDVNPLPSGLTRFTKGFWTRSDEFSSLVSTVNKLIARINMNYKLTRSWTLQMAHELKTPLAIIRARTESKKMANLIPAQYAEDVTSEIHGMSEVISQFLDWAELENSQGQRDIHSLRLTSVIQSVASRLEEVSPSRIHVKTCSDVSIFANPIHLDQLITNLVSNALKFSPFSKPVEIVLSNRTLSIRDYGSGLPQEVRERLGQPFNVGTNDENGFTGNGLGLAWVSTVAKLYNWEFEIRADSSGTEAIVQFPLEGI